MELRGPENYDGGDYDPWEHREKGKNSNSDAATIFNLVKACIGTGVLTLPICFFRAGLVPAMFYSFLVVSLTLYCMHILIRTQYKIAQINRIPYAAYGFTMNECFSLGPPCLKRSAKAGEYIVDVFIILHHMGTLTVYVTFISRTIKEVFELDIDIRLMMAMVCLPLLVIINVNCMLLMATVSAIGALVQVVCFGFLFYYIFREDEYGFSRWKETELFGDLMAGPILIGAMYFGCQTCGVLLELDAKMRNPSHLLGKGGIFPISTGIIVVFYIFIAIAGSFKYGHDVKDSISLNIPQEDALSKVIKAGFAFTVTCSYPIHSLPTVSIIWRKWIQPCVQEKNNPCNIIEHIIRTLMGIAAFLFALIIPRIDVIASLVGAITTSVLGVFLPALGHYLLLLSQREGKKNCIIWFDILVMILGVLSAFATIYGALYHVITPSKKENHRT